MPIKKSIPTTRKDIQERIQKAGNFWIDKQPADMGNYSGVVSVPGTSNMVYVRLSNGQVIQALNTVAPNIYNWKVFVGRDKSQPWIIKVTEVRWVYNLASTVAYILFHHKQHEYPSPDTIWIRRDQFTPLLILPAGGLSLRLFGDTIYKYGMSNPIAIPTQDIDTSPYVVTAGAKYVTFEILMDGTFNFIEGSTFDSLDLLYAQPIPSPTDGSFPVCCFIMYEGQTEHRRDDTQRTIIDLRQFTSDSGENPTNQIDFGKFALVHHVHPVNHYDEFDPIAIQVFS